MALRTCSSRYQLCRDSGSGVLLAIPAHLFSILEIKAPRPVDLSLFSEIYYPPVASLSLGLRADQFDHPLDGFGMLIPRVENFYSLGCLFTSSIFDGRAPHLSAANRSPKSRHAYTLHVIDRSCRYPAENWLQRGDDLPLRGFD